MTTRAEQETTVTFPRDGEVQIYSSIPAHVRRLRRDDRVTQTAGDATWGQFTVPADQWRPISLKARRRQLTDEERAKLSSDAARRFGRETATPNAEN